MRKWVIFICLLSAVLILWGCNSSVGNSPNSSEVTINKDKKIEVFLPKLWDAYSSVYEHWNELNLDKITLMDKPILGSSDIEAMDNNTLKTKKNFIIVNGTGLEDALIYSDKRDGVLKFEYKGEEYKIDSKSPELFYNYTIYDICVVKKGDNNFLVKQRDFKKEKDADRNELSGIEYKKGIIGIPYVIVVDGKKTELGILKVDDAEFAVPRVMDSWTYMGPPEGIINRFAEGKNLKVQD
ncbi:hypothetical protein [Clostridium tunisiense]|uniref:hypothetical protein n=1 Tax=Clostridium tunisiense TaxID=219748 RepID=UPI00031A8E09|nr:hypothetical protein [Clostridium tunisiense]